MLPQREIIPFDPHLVTQSVNYHGHKLLQNIVSDNAGQIHSIKLQDIDYKVYQSRQVELKNLGASRTKEITEFISSKADKLLVAQPELTNVKKLEETNYEDRYKHQIPFEFFLKADKNVRVDELLTFIEDGDIMYAEVVNNFENTAYTLLKPIAYDKGKHRFMSDLRPSDLKIILRNEDTSVPKADEDKIGRWMVGTRLRVEVLTIHLAGSVPTIFVSTKGITLLSETKEKFKLGKVVMKDLPQILSVSIDPSLRFVSDCIEKMDSYKNPQCIRQMADEMGINTRWYPTLLSSVRVDFAEKEKSESLRKAQMCKWAHKNVADGVAHFKQGQHEEAFQCLNKALQIDSENVEAFVAKGALLANLGRYEKAIEDFEKSLKLNPNHSNARKYMCETLVELGKQKEAKDLLKEAEKCYLRCLELNETHEVAKESLDSVSEKLGPDSNLMKLIKQEKLKHTDEYLADLLKIEEIAKKKLEEEKPIPTINQNREESDDEKLGEDNPIPIITTKYNKYGEEFGNENSTQMSPEPPHPLSPLSQKLANESLWSHPPPCAAPSFIGSLVPNQTSQGGNLPMSVYSNPTPNWPMPDITRPPPMPRMSAPTISEVANSYSEDSNYTARVEQFLKELDSRASKGRVSTSIKEPRRRSSQKEETKIRKRRRSSSSDSKASRSRSSSSSSSSSRSRSSSKSSSSSSSKSSTRSSSVDSRKKKKKVSKKAKKNKKKKKLKKKEKKAKKKSTPEVDVTVPEFDDLEEKLMAYYKKLETMNCTPPAAENKVKSKNKSPSNRESKSKDSEEDKEKEKTTTVASKLRLLTHPAFLEDDSDSDAELELKKKKAEKHKRMLSKIKNSTSESSPKTITEKVLQAAQACEKLIKVSSPSSPSTISSRSRSQSNSKGRSRRRSRSHSRGRSRRSRSRSRSHSKGRSSRRRSRSRSRERRGRGPRSRLPSYRSRARNYRPRSRSRSAERYRSSYHKISRSRSRERPSRYRRSRSRSPPSTNKSKMNKTPMHESPFSYYGNKPLYKNKSQQDHKNGTDEKTLDIPLPKNEPKPSPLKFEIRKIDKTAHLVEEAKRKIQQHILSNDKFHTSTTGRKNEKSNILDPSQRFGKWASETKDANKESPKNLDMFSEKRKTDSKDANFQKPKVD